MGGKGDYVPEGLPTIRALNMGGADGRELGLSLNTQRAIKGWIPGGRLWDKIPGFILNDRVKF